MSILSDFLTTFFNFLPFFIFLFVFSVLIILLFYRGDPLFTQIVLQIAYIILIVPVLVTLILTIPILIFSFALTSQDYNPLNLLLFLVVFICLTIILQYLYIKDLIFSIEQREKMSFINFMSYIFSFQRIKNLQKRRIENTKNNVVFYSKLKKLNEVNRKKSIEKQKQFKSILTNNHID